MAHKKLQRIATVQMLVCAVLWSMAGILIKLIDWNPFVIAGFRALFAAVTVGVYMVVTKRKFVISRDVLVSAVFLAGTFFAFVSANKLTTAANAIVLQYTAPIFIVLFSAVFLRQKFRLSNYMTVFFTFCGVALFFADSLREGQLTGDLVGLLSGVFFAGMFLAVGKTSPAEKMSGIFFGQVLTALIGIPVVFFTEGTVTPVSVAAIATLGIVQIGVPYILLALATSYCPPLACSLIAAVEPLLNPVWVLLFAGEGPGVMSLIGGGVIIAAVTAQCVLQDRAGSGRPRETRTAGRSPAGGP